MKRESEKEWWIKVSVCGEKVLIDKDFLPTFNLFTWHLGKSKESRRVYYPSACVFFAGKRTSIQIHRLVMGFPQGIIDHINRNKLDNRRCNLRLVRASGNAANRIYKNPLGFRGVSKKGNKYEASISHTVKGEKIAKYYLGRFNTPEEAAKAYDKMAKKRHGECAVLNYPESYGENYNE